MKCPKKKDPKYILQNLRNSRRKIKGHPREIADCEQDQANPIVNQFEMKYHLFVKKLSLNS